MKIAFIATHSSNAGAQLMWMNLTEEFAARGHEVELVALFQKDPIVARTPAGTTWTHLATANPAGPRAFLSLSHAIMQWLRRTRPDVVLTCMPLSATMMAALIPLASPSTRLVICHHIVAQRYSRLMRIVNRLIDRPWLAQQIVYVSEAAQQSFEGARHPARQRATVIRNALPRYIEAIISELARERRSRIAASPEDHTKTGPPLVLVATGHLRHEKNYPLLLRALARTEGATLRIVGRGIEEDEIRALAAQLGLGEKVQFLGFLPREQALAEVARADVFVQPSFTEGHSLAIVEAARLGVPIMVSDVPPQIEAVTDDAGRLCGRVIGVENVAAWSAAINEIAQNRSLLAGMARDSARLGKMFVFSDVADRYERVILEASATPKGFAGDAPVPTV